MRCAEGFRELVVTELVCYMLYYVALLFKMFDRSDLFGVTSWSNIWLIDVFLFLCLPSKCLLDFYCSEDIVN